jgi:hypothetical protein
MGSPQSQLTNISYQLKQLTKVEKGKLITNKPETMKKTLLNKDRPT